MSPSKPPPRRGRRRKAFDKDALLDAFALALRRRRERAGLTQAQVAELAGISVLNLQRMEGGLDSRLSTLARVARAYDVKLSTLVGVLDD